MKDEQEQDTESNKSVLSKIAGGVERYRHIIAPAALFFTFVSGSLGAARGVVWFVSFYSQPTKRSDIIVIDRPEWVVLHRDGRYATGYVQYEKLENCDPIPPVEITGRQDLSSGAIQIGPIKSEFSNGTVAGSKLSGETDGRVNSPIIEFSLYFFGDGPISAEASLLYDCSLVGGPERISQYLGKILFPASATE